MFTKSFWLDAAERAVKTFAQALLAVFLVAGTTVLNADWEQAFAVAGTAVLVSLLTSVVSAVKAHQVDDEDPVRTASLVKGVTYDKRVA
jgi:ABC-type lipoprotein release transport system permease subunit